MKTTRQYGAETDRALTMWVRLARAFATFNKRAVEHIRTFGLTQPQFGALETLGHKGAMTLGELCRKQLVSGGNMTVVIDNLEKRGLVERVRNQRDRRSIQVRLTGKGERLFVRIFKRHAAFVVSTASVLSGEEQELLGSLLKKLGLALQELPSEISTRKSVILR